MKKPWYIAVMGMVIPALIIGCSGTANGADSAETARVALQSSYSHSNNTEPDYSVVLPDDKVNEITITISPDNWQAVLDDMTSNYGEFGKGQGMGGGGRGGGQPGGGPGAGQPQAQADAAGNDQGNSTQNATPPADIQAMPTPQVNMATPEAQGQNGPRKIITTRTVRKWAAVPVVVAVVAVWAVPLWMKRTIPFGWIPPFPSMARPGSMSGSV
jgi:hypothetical protein